MTTNRDLGDRFWAKVDKAPGHGPWGFCWLWTQSTMGRGYGSFWLDGINRSAHRLVYIELVGDPGDMALDHLCRNRRCVNPAHLEPVTLGENVLRGEGLSATNARKTHCPFGHPLSGDNLRLAPRVDGRFYRECRACRARKSAERRAAAKGRAA